MGTQASLRLGQFHFAAIDFESAGAAAGETDCPVQIGIIRAEGLFGTCRSFESYLACDRPIHWRAAKVHGITQAQLKDAPSLISLWPQIKELLSDCIIVGHNLGTEKRFLRTFPGHQFGPWLDTLSLAKRGLPQSPDYSLGALCQMMHIGPQIAHHALGNKTWHDALYDAVASLELLRHIISQLKLEKAPLSQLDFCLKN